LEIFNHDNYYTNAKKPGFFCSKSKFLQMMVDIYNQIQSMDGMCVYKHFAEMNGKAAVMND
jgi:hypothetical protein